MNIKRSLMALGLGVSLCACSTSTTEVNLVESVATSTDLVDLMPTDTYDMMYSAYGDSLIYMTDMLNYVGVDISDISLETTDGETLTYDMLEGKQVVFEFSAEWCDYCKEQITTYMDDIYEANEDIVFVQVFIEGDVDEIEAFYEDAGKENLTDYTIAESDAVTEFIETLGVSAYPSFVFVDETGHVSWTYEGTLEESQFEAVCAYAYSEVKLYETFEDGDIDFDRLNRTSEDVAADLSDEAIALIATVETDSSNLDVLYANLNREFFSVVFTDIEGNTLDMETLRGENFIFEILTTDETYYTGSLTSTENLADYKGDYTVIQFWIASEDNSDIGTYLEENDLLNNADYIIPLTEDNNFSELSYIDVYDFPTQFFIDSDYRVAGVTEGAMTVDKYEAAVNAFFGKTALYEMGMTETEVETEAE